jgi:HEPN domain-containing protein
MLRVGLQKLALARVADARVLLAAGRYDAAYYLAGLAVECALKACIAAATQRFEFPDRKRADLAWGHDLNKLLAAADLVSAMRAAPSSVQDKWSIVSEWRIDERYKLEKSACQSKGLLQAVAGRGGVLPWVRQRW